MVSARSNNFLLPSVAASPGIAIGRARVADRARIAISEAAIRPDEVADEIKRFLDAVEGAKEDLRLLKEQLEIEKGAEHLYILDTHLLILEDPMLTSQTVSCIESQLINAEGSLKKTLVKFREFFNAIDNEYLRERGGDVEIIGERILRRMIGINQEPLAELSGKVIVIAHDLSPADVLQIDKNSIIGFATDLGGKTSHASILARSPGKTPFFGL